MKTDYYLSFVVLFQFVVIIVQVLLPLTGLISVERAAGYRIVYTLFTFIPAIFLLCMRNVKLLIRFMGGYIFLVAFHYVFFPSSHIFIESKQAYTLTPISILVIVSIATIRSFDCFYKVLRNVARITVVISFLYVIAHTISPFKEIDDNYSMSFGYSALLPAMFLFTQKRIIDKALSVILFILILIDGSRGPIVVLVLFYFYYIFFCSSSREKVKFVLIISILFIICTAVLPNMEAFQSSRTVTLIQGGKMISHDSNRSEGYYDVVINKIIEDPILGWGIGSDRSILDGSHSHNILLELLCHYGLFIGGGLFCAFLIWSVRMYMSTQLRLMQNGRVYFIMFFLYGFIPSLVSGSYLIDIFFPIMMGYMIKQNSIIFSKKIKLNAKH